MKSRLLILGVVLLWLLAAGPGLSASVADDPADLLVGTYLGGSDWEMLGSTGADQQGGVATDAAGNIYVVGDTHSTDFPATAGAYDTTHNGDRDAFVAKLDPTGSTLLWATFLGGSGLDNPFDITLSAAGDIIVTGWTFSSNFPTTTGAYDTTYAGGGDIFVAKLSAAGDALLWSTFVGGVSADVAYGLALDSGENVYLTGLTHSADFPTTVGAFDTTYNNEGDALMVKLSAAGNALLTGTFLGGSECVDDLCADIGYGVAVDGTGQAHVVGYTPSSDFPTTVGAYDTSHNGGPSCGDAFFTYDCRDAFAVKFNAAGSGLVYGTFVGGGNDDFAYDVVLDGSGQAIVAGETLSSNFPTTAGAYDTTYNFLGDFAVFKLNAAGSALDYSTFVGGTGWEQASALRLSAAGRVIVVGATASSDFPTTTGGYDTSHNGGYYDAALIRLDLAGGDLEYGTFLGGTGWDQPDDVAVDGYDGAFVLGYSESADFPTTAGAYDTTLGGYSDAFVSKLDLSLVMVSSQIKMAYEIFAPDELVARVKVVTADEFTPLAGATVGVTISAPDGAVSMVGMSDSQGWAHFSHSTAGGGRCKLRVDSVTLEGYVFDVRASKTQKTINCFTP